MKIKLVPGFQGLYREELGKEGTRFRILITRGKQKTQEYFYFGNKKSEADALAEAIKRWKELRKSLPIMLTSKDRMTSRNSSGVVGVHRHRQVITKLSGEEYEYFYWISKWPGCQLHGGVKWPTKTLGEDEAFVLAVLCRRMETTNRDRVIEALEGIRDKTEFKTILKLRKYAA
jgi:hypothetical protein